MKRSRITSTADEDSEIHRAVKATLSEFLGGKTIIASPVFLASTFSSIVSRVTSFTILERIEIIEFFSTVLVPWEKFSQTLLEFNKNVRQEFSGSNAHGRLEEFPELVKKKKELCRIAQAQAVLLLSQFMIAYSLEDVKNAQEMSTDKDAAERYYSNEIPLDALRYVSWIDGSDAEHQFTRNVLPALFSSTFRAIRDTLFEILEIDVDDPFKDATIDIEESKTDAPETSHGNGELNNNGTFLRSTDKQRELPPRRDKALVDNENTEQLILRHKERTMQRKKRDFKKELAKAFKGMK